MGKWINCKKCGHQYHSSLSRCPECGKSTVTFKKISAIIGTVLAVTVVAVGIISGFLDKGKEKIPVSSEDLTQSVVSDKSSDITENSEASSNSAQEQSVPSVTVSAENPSSKEETVSKPESGVSSAPAQSTSSTPELPITPTVGTVLKDGKAYVTVPLYYLKAMHNILSATGEIDFEEFAYSMTEEEKQNGGLYVVKNADGSATSVLTEKYYVSIRADALKQSAKLEKQLEVYDFVVSADFSNDFEGGILVLNVNSLSKQEEYLLNAAGITFLYNQYLNPKSDNSCTIELVFADKTKKTLKFPDIIK